HVSVLGSTYINIARVTIFISSRGHQEGRRSFLASQSYSRRTKWRAAPTEVAPKDLRAHVSKSPTRALDRRQAPIFQSNRRRIECRPLDQWSFRNGRTQQDNRFSLCRALQFVDH